MAGDESPKGVPQGGEFFRRGIISAALVGAAIGALGTLVSAVVLALSDDVSYAPLVGAVAMAVWAAGGAGGAGAILCAWTLAVWALTPPHELSLRIESDDEFVRWGVGLAVGVIVAALSLTMRWGRDRAAARALAEAASRQLVERLQRVTALLSAASLPEEVARIVVQKVPPLIGASHGGLGLLEGEQLLLVDFVGTDLRHVEPGLRLEPSSSSVIVAAAREGRHVWAQSRSELLASFGDTIARAPVAAGALGVPILIDERVIGAVAFIFREEDAVTEEVRAVAQIASELAGRALERAELYAEERASREGLDRILAMAPRFLEGGTPESVIASVCVEARRTFGCDAAIVWTPRADHGLEVTWREPPSDALQPGAVVPATDFPHLMEEMRALRTMFVANAQLQTRGTVQRHAVGAGVFSALRIPIVIGARFERILTLQWERVIPEPSASVLALTRRFADQAGLAIEEARRRQAEERTHSVQRLTEALSNALTTREVSRICLDFAADLVSASQGAVVLRRHEGSGPRTVVAAVGLPAASGAEDREVEMPAEAAALVARCASEGVPDSEGPWTALPLASGALVLKLPSTEGLAPAERSSLESLVVQAAQALDRASMYENQRQIAETLQRSVLPDRLPTAHGIDLAARYLPGTVGLDVGGDWYDVIRLDDGKLGLVVGDVVGKGVQAAAMMAQLRNALRAFAFEQADVHEVVSRLTRLVDGMAEAPFATLCYLVVDPRGGDVHYVVAGHPPPLYRAADGATSFLHGGRTLPIGVDSSAAIEVGETRLEPGSSIVLYTDGLVERRNRPLDEGLELLAATAGAACRQAEALTEALVSALTGDAERPDDVAILVLRLAAPVLPDLRQVVPSTQEGLVEMREALRSWLREGEVDEEAAADVVLAVWEAGANAVEHAQRPLQASFDLVARLDDGGWLRFEIHDSGQWKRDSKPDDRGLGLTLMRALMETVEVRTSAVGTTIALERRTTLRQGGLRLVRSG